MKIYQKLILILIFLSLFSTGFASFLFLNKLNKSIKENQDEKISIILSSINKMAEESELSSDPLMIFDYLKSISSKEEISYIYLKIKNMPWKKIKKYGKNTQQFNFSEIKTKTYQIKVAFSKEYFEKELKKEKNKVLNIAIGTYLISTFFSIIIALLSSRWIAKKIKSIETQAEKIGSGNFDELEKIDGRDEISTLAEKLNEVSKKLKEIDEMKKEFIFSATHELKSPLAAIESYINILGKNRKLSREELKTCENIKRNIKRLSNFITNILNISKIEKGQMDAILKDENPFDIIKDSYDFFKSKTDELNIKFKIEMDRKEILLKIDRELITHVLSNLISNAIKFTPNGGEIIIKAFINNQKFKFEIKDSGPGIDKENIDKLFIPFSRLKTETKTEGTGLGLAISKKIIDLHKGDIGVISEKGKGSIFFFELPL